MKKIIAIITPLLFLSNAALSSETSDSSNIIETEIPVIKSWGANVSFASIDKDVARINGVSTSALNLELSYTLQQGNLIGSFGFGSMLVDDEDRFSQLVEDNGGTVSTASSEISSFGVFGEGGYRHTINDNISAEFVAGMNIMSFERVIANCSDCREEELSLDTGLYVKPTINVVVNESITFSVGLINYLSGDFSPSIMFSIRGR